MTSPASTHVNADTMHRLTQLSLYMVAAVFLGLGVPSARSVER